MSNSNKDSLIAGIFPCLEALREGVSVEKIYLKKDLGGPNVSEIKRIAKEQKITINIVPIEKLNRLTRVKHQGVVAIQSYMEYHSIEQLLPSIFERGEMPLGLILDRVTDVRNFGSIARTAECMGCHFIIIPKNNSAQVNEDAMKSSAGALHLIPICKVSSLLQTIEFLQASGVSVIGASEQSESSLFDEELISPACVVMGSEMDGISSQILKRLDGTYMIPIMGKINSLNVSVATGMILSEINRQRALIN